MDKDGSNHVGLKRGTRLLEVRDIESVTGDGFCGAPQIQTDSWNISSSLVNVSDGEDITPLSNPAMAS